MNGYKCSRIYLLYNKYNMLYYKKPINFINTI